MRYLILSLLVATVSSLSAQFGVQTNVNFNNVRAEFPGAEELSPYNFKTGYEVALHYWFRLPKRRIEFQPTVFYALANTEEVSGFSEYGVQLKSNIYLFDLAEECDCPTFGKQGPQLQKGFFLQLAPGYSRYAMSLSTATDESFGGFNLGVALGLDFGISNFLTLTPIAGMRYGFSNIGPELEVTDVNGQPLGIYDPKLSTLQVGLQATFRLDKRRY